MSTPTASTYTPPPPMRGAQLVLATMSVALAGLMVILDMTIANVSVPTIAGSLAVSPSQGTWVVTSYSVADAIVVPLTGWLVSRFGTIRLFVTALCGFMLMSLACGLSSSLELLVAFRVLQGVAGAPLLALSQTMLFTIYPRERLAVGQAVFAMTAIIGPILGPILGGFISDNFAWPWIFFINVPVGILCSIAVWNLFRGRETPAMKKPVDAIGLALLIIAVGSLQLMLDKGKELDWFGSNFIIALAVLTVMGFSFLIAWELHVRNPIVNLRLFANRNYAIGVLTLSLIFGIFFGSVVLVPQWLQTYMGYTAFAAGLATAPNGILAIVLAPLIARLIGKVDLRIMVTVSIMVFLVTFGMRTYWTSEVDFAHIAIPQFIQGIGMACFFMPLTQMSLGSLQTDQIAMGAGLQNFARTAMAAFSASITTTLWDNQISRHHAQLGVHVTAYDDGTRATLDSLAAQGIPHDQALAMLDHLVNMQAVTLATVDYFAWAMPIFALLLILIWSAKPGKGGMTAMAGAH